MKSSNRQTAGGVGRTSRREGVNEMENKKSPVEGAETFQGLVLRVEALEKTTRYQYWIVLGAFILGSTVGKLLS